MKIINNIIKKIKNDIHLTELFKGGGISFFLKILGLVLGYVFTIVLARTLGAESVGIYSLSLAIITITGIIGKFGLDTTILRLNAEYKSTDQKNKIITVSKIVFILSFLSSSIIAVLVFLFADDIAGKIFAKSSLTSSIKIVSFAIVPFALSTISSSALRGFKLITKAVFIDYVAKFAYLLLFFLSGYLIFDITGNSIAILIVLTSWAMFLTGLFWYLAEIKKYINKETEKIRIKTILKIAFPLILASSVFYIKGWIDTISIGAFMTKADVGIYNIAYKLANLTIIPLVTINAIAAPKFAENILNKNELKLVLRKTIKLVLIVSTPILIGIVLLSNILLSVFGSEFTKANFVLIIIAIASFINAVFGSIGYLLQMTGHHLTFQNSVIILIVFSIVFNFYLIPRYGLIGAAVSTLLVNFIWNLILLIIQRNIVKL